MKTDKSVSAVLADVQQQHRKRRDFISHASNLRMQDDGSTLIMENSGNSMLFVVNDLTHSQLGSAMGIPAKYYEQMRKLKPGLLAENVNAWLSDKEL